ncbi:three-helix bundle dimerization domain-containing protein [Streptomyces vinaceus]|uniref:three-helix bundle dimerization domain-containing protein n=1 Tax=Streptomyces vinaceus TaxID=1960 RepID=UPI003803A3C1
MAVHEADTTEHISRTLSALYPTVAPAAVRRVVEDAYQELHGSRVTAYLLILVERRAKAVLDQKRSDTPDAPRAH